MFERFTAAARRVVVDGQEQARALRHNHVLAEHLLLGVLADDASVSAAVLRDLGVQRDDVAREVAVLGAADDDALRAIGVDLAVIRERVEATFGPGALDRPRLRRTGRLRRALRLGEHLRFTDPAKRALEQSLRQALALKHTSIGTDHILLGLLAGDQDPAARTLARLGVDPAAVRARVIAEMRRAA